MKNNIPENVDLKKFAWDYREKNIASVALKALTYFNDAEQEELPEGIRYQFSWDEIKRDLIRLSYEYFNQKIKKHKF
jgi:hypothetical protein